MSNETQPIELPPTVVDYIAAIPDFNGPKEIMDGVRELQESYRDEGSSLVDAALVLSMSESLRKHLLDGQELVFYNALIRKAADKLNAMTNMTESAIVVCDIYRRSLEKGMK